LYAAHALGGITDPWIFLSIPLLAGIVAGALASGAVATAGMAVVAGTAMLLVLLGLAGLSSAILQLLVRNRRRAEALVVVGMLAIVLVSLMPSVLIPEDFDREDARGPSQDIPLPQWSRTLASELPSELYVGAVRQASAGATTAAAASAAGLLAWALLAHGVTWPIYQRLLGSPASNGGTRRRATGGRLHVRVPGLSPRTAAVAISYVRLGLRTPRGRTIILMPVVMLLVFAGIFYSRGTALPLGPVRVGAGYSLGLFGLFLGLMSLTPFAFNQFAVDRAGLTLQFLSPISTRELLYGKAIGGAIIAAIPCVLSIVVGIVTGAHSLLLWLAIALGALSTYILLSPAAAVLSLVFPRAVDLSSAGQASNAHQAAGLIGLLAFAAACAPSVAVSMFALRVLESPGAAAALLALWTLVALALSHVGFLVAERLLDERKENLAMVATGR
jgi:hypothetical protein